MSIHYEIICVNSRKRCTMFSDLLKQLRAEKGVSQVELARAISVSNATSATGSGAGVSLGMMRSSPFRVISRSVRGDFSASTIVSKIRETTSPRTSRSRGLPVTALRCPKRKPI